MKGGNRSGYVLTRTNQLIMDFMFARSKGVAVAPDLK